MTEPDTGAPDPLPGLLRLVEDYRGHFGSADELVGYLVGFLAHLDEGLARGVAAEPGALARELRFYLELTAAVADADDDDCGLAPPWVTLGFDFEDEETEP
jgi:hypothetical protein